VTKKHKHGQVAGVRRRRVAGQWLHPPQHCRAWHPGEMGTRGGGGELKAVFVRYLGGGGQRQDG
jgi:hypothetical protein